MTPGTGGRRTEILAAARELLEAHGEEGLTMRAIAERLGIRAPSLYKHFPDKASIEVGLIAIGFEESAVVFAAAVGGSPEPLPALGRVYRAWALEHPHLYRLMTDRPLPRDRLPEGLEARAAQPVVDAADGDPDLARAAWALAHGLASLELAGRFPPGADVEAAWEAGTAALTARRRLPG